LNVAAPLPLELPHKTIRCVDCDGVFETVREFVAHYRTFTDLPSECRRRQRGIL
jgi:hypothetical protein